MASDRSTYDGPARVVTVIAGFVLIGVSIPLVIATLPKDHEYVPTWRSDMGLSSTTATSTEAATTTSSTLTVTNLRTASLVVTVPSCNDAPATPTDQPAQLSWVLERQANGNKEQLARDTLTCGQAGAYAKELSRDSWKQPDATPVSGTDPGARDQATATLWSDAASGNETAQYVLTVSWVRPSPTPGSPLPLPGLSSAFNAQVRVTEKHWEFDLNEKTKEVVK